MNLPIFFNLLVIAIFGLILGGIIVFLRLNKKVSFIYLTFFSLFYVYLFKVLDYTIFQFQSLLILKLFMPDLLLKGQEGKNINLIPIITLTSQDLNTSLLNIVLFIPFGFGLPFITDFRMRKVVVIGALFSTLIELTQLLTGAFAKTTFRVTDINDLIFNTLGVIIGYFLFVEFTHLCKGAFHNIKIKSNPILEYISKRPQIS